MVPRNSVIQKLAFARNTQTRTLANKYPVNEKYSLASANRELAKQDMYDYRRFVGVQTACVVRRTSQ